MKQIIYKVPEGKLLRIHLESKDDIIVSVKIHGDFFLHPEECISQLEQCLIGSQILRQEIMQKIDTVLIQQSASMVGASSEAIADAILTEKTGLREILPGIYSWSYFNKEKGYTFNSYAFCFPEKTILIDPVEIPASQLEKLSTITDILLTNKDHERAAYELRRHLNAKIWIRDFDAQFLREPADVIFDEKTPLPGGFQAIPIAENKSPGETAFYDSARKILIVGDAIIGWPKKEVSLLPAIKYQDVQKTIAALSSLLHLEFDILFVGDGECIYDYPRKALERLLERKENIHLSFPVKL